VGRSRLALLLTAVVLGALLGPPAAAGRAKHQIVVAGGPQFYLWRWDPAELEISRGDRVVWNNPSNTDHHMTPYDGPWKNKGTKHLDSDGGRASFRFKKPGVYLFRCDRPMHSELIGETCFGQCGEITVER
jgi:plastocyanin